MRYRDTLKRNLKNVDIPFKQFESLARNRTTWRDLSRKGAYRFEEKRVSHQQLKRAARKGTLTQVPDGQGLYKCPVCGRICLSNAGLKSHERVHHNRITTNYDNMLTHQCPVCHKVYKSSGGLKNHMRIHKGADPVIEIPTTGKYICNICQKSCRSLAGLKSHFRAHNANN